MLIGSCRPCETKYGRSTCAAAHVQDRVDVELAQRAAHPVAHVRDVDRDERQAPLDRDVPRVRLAPVHRVGHGGLDAEGVRQREAAGAEVRIRELRNPLIQRAVPAERGLRRRGVEARVQHQRVALVAVKRQLTRHALRVVGEAVAGANHRLLVQPVDGADTRRKRVLRRVEPHVLRVAADAADQHVERVQVEHLDLVILPPHDRVVLPAQAQIERELRRSASTDRGRTARAGTRWR